MKIYHPIQIPVLIFNCSIVTVNIRTNMQNKKRQGVQLQYDDD